MASAVALAVVAAAGTSQAAKVNWKVDGTFNDGATFHGSFAIDTLTDTITRWDFNTTADPPNYGGISYSPCLVPGCGIFATSSASDNAGTLEVINQVFFFVDDLQLTGLPLTTGGVIGSIGGQETQSECAIGCAFNNTRTITGGTALGLVPEPATWATMLLGLGGIGALTRRRRALATA